MTAFGRLLTPGLNLLKFLRSPLDVCTGNFESLVLTVFRILAFSYTTATIQKSLVSSTRPPAPKSDVTGNGNFQAHSMDLTQVCQELGVHDALQLSCPHGGTNITHFALPERPPGMMEIVEHSKSIENSPSMTRSTFSTRIAVLVLCPAAGGYSQRDTSSVEKSDSKSPVSQSPEQVENKTKPQLIDPPTSDR